MQALMYPGVEERLLALSAMTHVRLVLVTGRSARELRRLLPAGIRADIWGSHGRELLQSNQAHKLFPLSPEEQAALDQVTREMTLAGFGQTLEVKPASVAVHWRTCEPALQARIQAKVRALFSDISHPGHLQLLPFDGGVELRSTDRTKGTAVREILHEQSAGIPAAYLGDDFTDEDAFLALEHRGLSLLVRSEVRPSAAQLWLRPPEDLLAFLDLWAVSR